MVDAKKRISAVIVAIAMVFSVVGYFTITQQVSAKTPQRGMVPMSQCNITLKPDKFKAKRAHGSKGDYVVQKPEIIITHKKHARLNSKYYRVTYSNKNSKKPGTYKVTVRGNETFGFTGSRTLTYKIVK